MGEKKTHKKSENRGRETPASLPWSLKTPRHGPAKSTQTQIWRKYDGQLHRKGSKKGKKQKGYTTERLMPGNAVIMLIF